MIPQTAKGLIRSEVIEHLAATHREVVSPFTDKTLEIKAKWRMIPLKAKPPSVFINSVHIVPRDEKSPTVGYRHPSRSPPTATGTAHSNGWGVVHLIRGSLYRAARRY